MIDFTSTVQRILLLAALYVFVTSIAIFIHWMWFSHYDIVIGRRMKKNGLKPGQRLFMNGLALSSTYYAEQKRIAEEEAKIRASMNN